MFNQSRCRRIVTAIAIIAFAALSTGASVAQTAPAIESDVFEYQALTGNATMIADRVSDSVRHNASFKTEVVVATNADVGTIMQFQVLLGQASLVRSRINKVTDALNSSTIFQCNSPRSVAKQGAAKVVKMVQIGQTVANVLSYPILNASSLVTLAQLVSSLAAVNETVTPAAGALNDSSLVNLVAGKLGTHSLQVIVPSVIPPNIAGQPFSGSGNGMRGVGYTIIGKTIADLEYARLTMYEIANKRILSPQCQYTTQDQKGNKTVVNLAVLNQMAASVTSASALLDAFEAQLFGGSPISTQTVAAPPAAPAAAASKASGNAGTANAPPAAPTLPAPPAQAPSPPSASALQQLLYADLTLQQLGETAEHPFIDKVRHPNAYILSVHALESGGSTLTKSAFLGSRVFYSGGAVTTFSLYDASEAHIACGGASYAYRGFISEHQMGMGTSDNQTPGASPSPTPDVLPAMNYFVTGCGK